ncbi:hypothetical protein BCR36DRAFT_353044 [Piromyces finnis]|uniref:Uncharacterized protein n=1 Tax=Piromyces finnis TaxID=1754191 RepID=A0A1Y1VA26_9FUNG|nr:hypothetical protein BCR36DRAFT_353044 [Piromyces finnis]|eukprot:ORX50082.1 hypothetical protein BCR36DRAFT_353044 [Piromyces finnis]
MIQEEDIFDLSEKVLITFKNEEYILNAYALLSKDVGISSKESLVISIKKESTNEIWKGKYTNNYVEEITKKTGNFKKFSVFVEMLFSAIKMSSKTVTLDLLTLNDVKKLRENRGDDGRVDTTESNKLSKNKLFLILTYSAAFDRVHYPLPLTFQGFDEDVSSISLIEKLQREIELLKDEKENNISEISKLLRENDKLKYEMKQLQDLAHENSMIMMNNDDNDEKVEIKMNRITHFVKKEFETIIKLYKQRRMQSIVNDKLLTLQKYILQAFSKYENDKKNLEDKLITKDEQIDSLKSKIKILQSRQQSLPKKNSSSSISKQRSSSISSIKKEVKSSGYNIIKSRPLKPSYMTREKSKTKRNTSRTSSVSSFKRFDPTAYVREREQKLEERRARSRELSIKSKYSRNNSLGLTSNASSTRSLSKKNSKYNNSSNSLYSSRSKSIDRNSISKKNSISDPKSYRSKYDRSSSTVRNNVTKSSRNNSLSKISYTSSQHTVKPSKKRSTSKVTKSRNSSLSSVKYSRDPSINSRKMSTTNLSYSSAPKKYASSKVSSQANKIKNINKSTISVRKIPNKVKSKSTERVIIKKTKDIYDEPSTQENNTVDYESQYLYENDFEEIPTEENNETNNIETEKDNQWNSYDINDSQEIDIDARLEAIQKYLKDTQEEF